MNTHLRILLRCALAVCFLCQVHALHGKPRARDLGIPFEGAPGPLNAITDVKGVEVGHATVIRGKGKLRVGRGPARTGVTAVFPRGKSTTTPVFAGWFSLNGNGEMTGTTWVEESGLMEGPFLTTNTYSVGTVRDGVLAWFRRRAGKLGLGKDDDDYGALPVVGETWDGDLNDIQGFHVRRRHVFHALSSAKGGVVAEGNVGGGTGMICFEFKGGIGTASRRLPREARGYTVGVLVQANFGLRKQLRIAGVPVGQEVPLEKPARRKEKGSIIIVIATDAPLLPHQLKRLARRASHGLARTGSVSGNGSGDLFLAFSTANASAAKGKGVTRMEVLANDDMDDLFEATVQATEEAIINALVAAETMTGINAYKVIALPHQRVREVLKKYNRLEEKEQQRTGRR
jgi:L-aminopeptidase/D-esterase-like protein